MFGSDLKEKARSLPIAEGSKYSAIQQMIIEGVFDTPKSSEEVAGQARETHGNLLDTTHVHTYMMKFLRAGIIRGIKSPNTRHILWVLACVPKSEALKAIGNCPSADFEGRHFSPELIGKLEKGFRYELQELKDNLGKNGNCSAFLLRKILEKLILIVFAKYNKQHLLVDTNRPGGLKGLNEMIEVAAREKIDGISIILPKTATEIKGVKFLGDNAAHNPLVGVDMQSIVPQMPFIITAYKELAKRL